MRMCYCPVSYHSHELSTGDHVGLEGTPLALYLISWVVQTLWVSGIRSNFSL